MDATHHNTVRCQRMTWLLQDLAQQVSGWRQHRRLSDSDAHGQYVGRHASQLAAVGTLLDGSLAVLTRELAAIDPQTEAGEVFARSRQVADAVVWLERVWRYFAERFDQRDASDRRAKTLQAADEMVWSCYRPLYEHPRIEALNLPPQPPPLAYVEPQYSPAARTGDRSLDGELKPSSAIQGLGTVADQLPMPLLRLPPWCLDAPWWLIFVAHEVGHHLQHDLKLVDPFRLAVEEEAKTAGADSRDMERWGRWGEEIFADLCSLLLMGPWALWALVEVERGPENAMQRRRPRYPAAWVRLYCMAKMLKHLGLDTRHALRGLDLQLPPDAPAKLIFDFTIADRLSAWPTRAWDGIGSLHKLLRFQADHFQAHGTVEQWASDLLSDQPLQPPRHLDSARHIIAGSVAAWARLSQNTVGDDLQSRSHSLAQRTMDAMLDASPPGTRTAMMPDVDARDTGQQLGQHLLQLSRRKPSDDADSSLAEDGEPGKDGGA